MVGTRSWEGDLAEKGYKGYGLGEEQANLLLAYDAQTGVPLVSRFYEGGVADKVCVGDLLGQTDFHNLLILVDRRFYSEENLALFTSNGCSYVIALSKGLSACRQAVADMKLAGAFVWERGYKGATIEYKEQCVGGRRVLVLRDTAEAGAMKANYLRHVKRGDKSYTMEHFARVKDLLGVTVLQTSLKQVPLQ